MRLILIKTDHHGDELAVRHAWLEDLERASDAGDEPEQLVADLADALDAGDTDEALQLCLLQGLRRQ